MIAQFAFVIGSFFGCMVVIGAAGLLVMEWANWSANRRRARLVNAMDAADESARREAELPEWWDR